MKEGYQELSEVDCDSIAKKIREDIYAPAFSFKTTIFLCGGDISNNNNLRYRIAKTLSPNLFGWLSYDFIYPEDIFDELLFSSKSKDLLSLEHLLAKSVDAIVLIPESPGSFAELGAFANDEKLRHKLICVVDIKYKKDKSFINKGPLKLVKDANPFGLVFIDPDNIEKQVSKLHSALRKMKKISQKSKYELSLLQLDQFLLPSIYLLEPVKKDILVNLVSSASKDNENGFQLTITVLSILIKKKQIQLTNDGYILTRLGLEYFAAFQKTKTRIKKHDEKIQIDKLRLEILNLKNRKKKLREAG